MEQQMCSNCKFSSEIRKLDQKNKAAYLYCEIKDTMKWNEYACGFYQKKSRSND